MILPTPPAPFRWKPTSAGPALVCRELEPFAAHLFTTRGWKLGACSDAAAWTELASTLGAERVARIRQVHGNRAIVADAFDGQLADADIVATNDPRLVVAVQTADCVPLLLVDRRTGAVAAAHAGWRGLAARAPVSAVAALAREFGTKPPDILAAAGPSIGACCYEVGPEVRDAFAAAGFGGDHIEWWFAERPGGTAENPSMPLGPRRADRWFFDGWIAAREQLESAGVPAAQIFSARLCTASHPDVLCSYRREGRTAGRIAGAIRPAPRRP